MVNYINVKYFEVRRGSMEKKFRVWDDCTKQMVYFNFEDLCRHNEKPFEHTVDGVNASYPLDYDELWLKPIMQSTGLFDKTGKEIYEGDIIPYSLSPMQSDIINCVITFNNGKFVGVWSDEYGGYDLEFLSLGEVIGNIYENSDLMRDVKWLK
jgi:uncharacterized phage protein (TIGR01671 family)